ncbi:MAG TPA: hypothetical protein VMX36_13860 [Sedimentisphaerales bacterium]|nr:hypothetical protein [Sedimentisphaerales bacterium]
MSEELDVLKIVTRRLNEAEIPYMISGSIAANYYTVPRMTRDVDIVIELQQGDVDKFVGLFEKDFYMNRETVTNEVSRQGMFNLIHNRYVIKIDFIIKKSSAYQQAAFSRRKQVLIEQSPMWFVSAEDLIISKLLWAKDSHSEMQLKDVANLIDTADNLDSKHINNWVRELGLEQIYKEARDVRHAS